MQRRTLRFVVLVIVALLVIGLVLATTTEPSEPSEGQGVRHPMTQPSQYQ